MLDASCVFGGSRLARRLRARELQLSSLICAITPSACDGNFSAAITTGCTSPEAVNYDSAAAVLDGSCVFAGCTNPAAANYNVRATQDDGSCAVPRP